MAILSKADYVSKFNDSSTGLLKDNTTKAITPLKHRTQVEDTGDSFVNKVTDGYYGTFSTSGTNTYTASSSPTITAYTSGDRFIGKFNAEIGRAHV